MHDAPPSDVIESIDRGVAKAESVMLVLVLAVMVGLSALQLVLRKGFDFGFEWADLIVRQMVLWLGFLGGALATHQGRHIAIDAVCRLLRPTRAALVRASTSVLAAVISGILTWAGWQFLQDELSSNATVYGDIPSWPFQAIIPVAFVAITFHFLVAARGHVLIAMGRREPPPAIEPEVDVHDEPEVAS